ncbi:MAG TPA: histidine kinase [Anaeromyxobacter sp.]|nr:histidine kinase [Anaeromyxobacter sp.]
MDANGDCIPREERERLVRRKFLQAIPITLVANTLIAAFLAVLVNQSFWPDLLYSQAIGCSVLFFHWIGHHLARDRAPHWVVTAASLLLGAMLGIALIVAVEGRGALAARTFLLTGTTILVFGTAMTYFFVSRGLLAAERARLQRELLAHEESARRLAEAELKLLQAQIEPHFLFNTLSNVLGLVDSDPQRAKRMLRNLTSYLRGSLRRTRAGPTTLGEELELVHAYLEIQAVRMGDRLVFGLSCPEELRGLPLPPLLVQPLVENALRHGLEPKPGGGGVWISAARRGDTLVLEVRDDGLGLDPHQPAGVGLSNVRERVRTVSGGRGALTLHPVETGGLTARLTLPLDALAPPAPLPRPSPGAGGAA